MIELRTLGAVDLRSSDGAELRAVLQQPKRLALLVYLASAKPGKLIRRDSLLALFWPELDQDHARAALRRALYFLRQAGGPDLIVSRGDEEVGVAADRIWCDANAFDLAVDENQLERALETYRGDFLDGFYVQGAPEAEAWLDRERIRRRYDAALASWQLARAALPDLSAAARWAQRAIELAPQDEDAILAYLLELERRGERSLALRLYSQAAERIQTELGTAPHAKLTTAADRIRNAGPVAVVATARDEWLVAVCPFVVRGDPGFAYLAEGMVDLLSTKLDGTGALRTTDPRTVLQLAGPTASTGADLATGARIAEQLSAGLFVIGTIVESGGRLEASVGLHQADRTLRARVEGRTETESGLFDLVDELIRRLVADFDQSAAGRLSRLAALTTSSLPALRAYLQGEHEFRLGRHLQALDLFRRSTGEDPSFALAYYRLASSLAANALIGPARQASADAYRHRDRLSDHDRLLLEAQHAWLHGHTGEAERRYVSLTMAFPEHVEPWYLLGDLLLHANPYRGRSIVEAREPLERALRIDSAHIGALTQLARLAALEGRREDLARLVDRALELSPTADQALGLDVLRAFALGSPAEQQAVVEAVARASGLVIARAFTDITLYVRDLAGAERLAAAVLPAARSNDFAALGNIILAHLELALGRDDAVTARLATASRLEPVWGLELRAYFAALPFADTGKEARDQLEAELQSWNADGLPASIAPPFVFHDGLHPHLRSYLLGLLAARRKDAAAVRLAAETLSELAVPAGAEAMTEQLGRTLDALAWRLEGRPGDALAALERLKTDVWFQYAVGSPFFAGTYQRFLRAELLEQVGRVDEAIRWWETIAQRSPFELAFAPAAASRIRQAASPQVSS